MKVFVAGGSGFIGSLIVKALLEKSHEVSVLTRKSALKGIPPGLQLVKGNSTRPGEWQKLVETQDVIINLAGASIFRWWSSASKNLILESRTATTRNIVEAIGNRKKRSISLINFSGIGYYGHKGDDYLDENASAGNDFLAQVAAQWEEAALVARKSAARVLICRLGHVLGNSGGILPKLTMVSKLHTGGYWGRGNQWISWIHQQDLCSIIEFFLDNCEAEGVFNITAPNPIRNKDFMAELNKCTGVKPVIRTVPGPILRLLAGEFSSVFLNGQRAVPARIIAMGYKYYYDNITGALQNLLGFARTSVAQSK